MKDLRRQQSATIQVAKSIEISAHLLEALRSYRSESLRSISAIYKTDDKCKMKVSK